LSQSYLGDLRVGVDDARDGVVVNVTMALDEGLHGCEPFVLCLVREHGAADAVANRKNGRHFALESIMSRTHIQMIKEVREYSSEKSHTYIHGRQQIDSAVITTRKNQTHTHKKKQQQQKKTKKKQKKKQSSSKV
jgi:hypothetical protein